jgi:hypothetical protein
MGWEQEYLKRAKQQPLFDDLPPLEEERIELHDGGLRWYSDPRSDNQKLMSWQYEYRIQGNQEALSKIYELCRTIAAKFINTIGKKNRNVKRLSEFDKEAKASDAADYIVVQLMTRPDFQITKSWTGYLYLRVEFELFYRREVDKIVDFVDLDKFFKEGTEPTQEMPEWEEKEVGYIAYGEHGNMEFKTKEELLLRFGITEQLMDEVIRRGSAVLDPLTAENYYLDELKE